MKRSDMVEYLSQFFDMHGINNSFNHETIEDFIGEMLDLEVALGMLPPSSGIYRSGPDEYDFSNSYTWEHEEPKTCGFCEKPCGNKWCVTNEDN